MSTTYDGNPDNYPTSITIPSDGDGPGIKAADVNAAFEGLADRTARVAIIQQLNWFPKITQGTDNKWAILLPSGVWFVVGDAEDGRRSTDATAVSWGSNELAATLTGEDVVHADVDASGNIVAVLSTGPDAVQYNGSVWALATIHAGAAATYSVVYDPVAAKWCAISFAEITVGFEPRAFTSTNRTTWTLTNTFTGLTGLPRCMAVRKATGKIVAMFEAGGTISPRTSANGGATWSSPANLTSTITSATEWSLSFNSIRNEFIFVIGETSGTPSCEVWVSANDGATWTKKATLANWCLQHCAQDFRGAYVSVSRGASRNEVAYSTDGGTTWQRAGVNPDGVARGVFDGAGGLLMLTDSDIYRSVRFGGPSLGNLT